MLQDESVNDVTVAYSLIVDQNKRHLGLCDENDSFHCLLALDPQHISKHSALVTPRGGGGLPNGSISAATQCLGLCCLCECYFCFSFMACAPQYQILACSLCVRGCINIMVYLQPLFAWVLASTFFGSSLLYSTCGVSVCVCVSMSVPVCLCVHVLIRPFLDGV